MLVVFVLTLYAHVHILGWTFLQLERILLSPQHVHDVGVTSAADLLRAGTHSEVSVPSSNG